MCCLIRSSIGGGLGRSWPGRFCCVWLWGFIFGRGIIKSASSPLGFWPCPPFGLTFESARGYSRGSIPPESQKLGIKDKGYVPRVLLYVSFGLLDAMWQTTSYWLIGAMSNSPQRLAHFTGFCKSPLSPRYLPSGLMPPGQWVDFWKLLFFQINLCSLLVPLESGGRTELVSRKRIHSSFRRSFFVPCPVDLFFVNRFLISGFLKRYLNIFYSTWGLLLGGLVFALPMMHMRIKDHTTDTFDDDGDTSSLHPHSDTWED